MCSGSLAPPAFPWGSLGQSPAQPTLLEQRPLPPHYHHSAIAAAPSTRSHSSPRHAVGSSRPWGDSCLSATAATSPGQGVLWHMPGSASMIWPLWLLLVPSPKAPQGSHQPRQFGGSFTVKSYRDAVHQQPAALSWALLPAPGRAAAPLPPPSVTGLSRAATGTWQGWDQQGSLRVVRSHCRTSARPVPSRALVSSIVMGCVAQDTMSCMRNSDFISTRDM